MLLLLFGQSVNIEYLVLSLVGAALTVVDGLRARHHATLLERLIVAAVLVELALPALHDLVNDILDGRIVHASTADAVYAVADSLEGRLRASSLACRDALLLESRQPLGGRLQFGIHVLALLLGQSQFCDLLLRDGDGCGIVALDAAETVEHIVEVATALDGCLKVLEEVAPVAIVQCVEKDIIGTLGTFHRPAPFVDTAFRLEESVFCHLYGCSRHTNHTTKLCDLVDAQAELSGHGIERTRQAATAIDRLIDVVELHLALLNAAFQLVERCSESLAEWRLLLCIGHLLILCR